MTLTSPIPTATSIPEFITSWYERLQPRPLAEVIADPASAAIFSTDMTVGFCERGNLASARVGALKEPVVDLIERAHALGMHHFVLAQDTHHPQTPEFEAWPVHCVRGTDEAETIPELKSLPFANLLTVIEKNSLHPALETEFDPWLDAHPGLRIAIVVGNCTDLCVYQLAMHLRVRHNARNVPGMLVIVPADAVDTYDLSVETAAAIGALPHPGDFFHQVFLYHMALNGIQVVRELV
ncbi:MAG TPA: isochorismatase family protein [Thermomicrobiales bacterium]|nr:isochorismatase family protein [Thermomicrobiales bacterium]